LTEIDSALVHRLCARANAERWHLTVDAFARTLARSADRAFAGERPDLARLQRYFESLHLEDLALACACAEGVDVAWEHFVFTYRPLLYRAADALDASGRAREAADSLYAELYGLAEREGQRHSHFRYFHGRSSLATWLRAVLSQRYVDLLRGRARLAPLPADDGSDAPVAKTSSRPATFLRYVDLLRRVITGTVAALPARDRLRLRCYYAENLTLAQIGALLREHEATVSRNLSRTRRTIRQQVETELSERERLTEAEIAECFAAVMEDSGPMDLAELLGSEQEAGRRKNVAPNRST
jgi:RNA polymerase sigma-70 factor (ECF subfamily)